MLTAGSTEADTLCAGPDEQGVSMVKIGWRSVLMVFAAAAVGTALQGCGTGTSTSTGTSQPGAAAKPGAGSDAVLLASYQENAQADAHDPLARSFQRSLTALKPLCRESSHRVAAESWATWNDLLKNKVKVSLLHVVHALQTVGKGVPSKGRPTDCAALLAAYAVEVESGNANP